MQNVLNILTQDVINGLPNLIGAILILFIGVFIANKLKIGQLRFCKSFVLIKC